MSFFDKPFDSSKVDPAGAYTPIPDGEYFVMIKSATEKPNKKKTGTFLEVVHKVLSEGPAKGREVTQRITLTNSNAQAAEIGQRELSALCRAVQIQIPKRAGDFVGKSLTIKVVVVPRNDRPDEMTNEVKGPVLKDAQNPSAPAASAPAAGDAAGPAPWG